MIYAVPMIVLLLFYWKITSFIRQQPKNQAIRRKRRQQRDIIVLRRIFIIVAIIAVVAFPAFVFILIALISGTTYYLSYRIMWPLISIGLLCTSISLVLVTPPVKRIFIDRFICKRVRGIRQEMIVSVGHRHIVTVI